LFWFLITAKLIPKYTFIDIAFVRWKGKMVQKNLEDLLKELVEVDKEIERRIKDLKELMFHNGNWERYIV
jgi:hypothetical protein